MSLLGAKIGGSLEMNGALVGELVAQNADVGGSLFLRAWDGVGDSVIPFRASGEVFLVGAKIRADLDLAGATLWGKVYANNMSIGGNAWLIPWKTQPFIVATLLDLSGTEVRNSLNTGGVQWLGEGAITIDLSHSTVGVLNDENGLARCDATLLRLEGFDYARLAVTTPATHAGDGGRPLVGTLRRRRRSSASANRLRWLDMQYQAPARTPNIDNYSPDVYDRLTRAFRAAGYYADARAVTRERLRVERRIAGTSFARPFQAAYALLFDSGLSPRRAIITFIGCISIGWAAAHVADHGSQWLGLAPVLVIETNTVSSLAVPSGGTTHSFLPGLPIGTTGNAAGDELPCGDEIEPLLYALDVFVPALEIHQEARCAITTGPDGFVWRMARAVYSLVGWVVTALTVLTVPGVARRHLEG